MSLFKKAQRSQTKLRMALTGISGSGKTLSALKIARGLVGPTGKIALIDTENGSASYYSGEYDFDTAQMSPPYIIKKYISAISEAVNAGYDCVIVDSLSHAWMGEGGVLQQKELLDQKPGSNHFTNWGKMTPQQNQLVSAVLQSKTNIICTMRSKTEYLITKNSKGQDAPVKVGLAAQQREGFEYEFDIVLDISLENHTAGSSKDRTGIFVDLPPFQINETHGELIRAWQASGSPLDPEPEKKAPPATAPAENPPEGSSTSASQPSSGSSEKLGPQSTTQNTTSTPSSTTQSLATTEPIANEAYKVPFDGPYKDRLITDIPFDRLKQYSEWVHGEMKKDSGNPKKNNATVHEFLIRSGEVLDKLRLASKPDDLPA